MTDLPDLKTLAKDTSLERCSTPDMVHEPTVHERRPVKVLKFYNHRKERENIQSIKAAVQKVKDIQSNKPASLLCTKIVTKDDDVVYNSEQNGDIQEWEAEWWKAKKRLSPTENVHTCPHENIGVP